MFSKLLEKIKGFEVYLAIIASLIAVYGFFEAKFTQSNPVVTITINSVEHLTMLPKADGFRAEFLFKDSVVKDLWKVRFTAENTGKATIIGRGYQKSILDTTIRIAITQGFDLISKNLVQSSFPVRQVPSKDNVEFAFDQWRPGEIAVFEGYAVGLIPQSRKQPSFELNDRQLINGKSVYKEISYASEDKKIYLKDVLPKFISNAMWWFYVMTSLIIIVVMPFAIIDEYKKRNKYKLWMLVYKPEYDVEIQGLITSGVLDRYYEPLDLSEENWKYFITPKIFVKAKPNVSSVVLGATVVFSFFWIPLFWMIKIFW